MTERSESGSKKPKGQKDEEGQLSDEELAREKGEALPDRAALSTLKADVAIPISPALAADVLTGADDEMGEEIDEPVESKDPPGDEDTESDS